MSKAQILANIRSKEASLKEEQTELARLEELDTKLAKPGTPGSHQMLNTTSFINHSEGLTFDAINNAYTEVLAYETNLSSLVKKTKEYLTKAGVDFAMADDKQASLIQLLPGIDLRPNVGPKLYE